MAASVGTIAHALHARRGLALHLLDTQKPKIPIPTICQYLSGPGAQWRKSMLMWHPDKWSRVSERVDDPSLLMELTQHAQAMTRSSVKVLLEIPERSVRRCEKYRSEFLSLHHHLENPNSASVYLYLDLISRRENMHTLLSRRPYAPPKHER